jgi:hypothetical protein
VADPLRADALSATRQFVLVVRVVVRPDGGLQGELLDPETEQTYPFVGTSGLAQKVEDWLRRSGPGRQQATTP